MRRKVNEFLVSEDGAITVDWVVICAAVVGLAALISSLMHDNAVNLADLVSNFMTAYLD